MTEKEKGVEEKRETNEWSKIDQVLDEAQKSALKGEWNWEEIVNQVVFLLSETPKNRSLAFVLRVKNKLEGALENIYGGENKIISDEDFQKKRNDQTRLKDLIDRLTQLREEAGLSLSGD